MLNKRKLRECLFLERWNCGIELTHYTAFFNKRNKSKSVPVLMNGIDMEAQVGALVEWKKLSNGKVTYCEEVRVSVAADYEEMFSGAVVGSELLITDAVVEGGG